ncbi:MAG TPA: quercetin 2,3-dioxygenase [Gaiellaceae bacterium]|jgi:quercetin dioxygenase-like cupin family protein
MSQVASAAPIALQQGEGEARWFLGGLCTIKSSGAETGGRVAVTENWAPRGHGSPLHVHRREDEWFYVLSGELTFWIDGRVVVAGEGSFVFGPRDVPHTFTVTSGEARFLLVVEPAGLDDFIRTLSEPAQSSTLPPDSLQPPAMDAMLAAAAEHGIEILGPPGIPD